MIPYPIKTATFLFRRASSCFRKPSSTTFALIHGEEVIRRIADYRAEDKADPLYYARLTVTKAHADFHAKHADETHVTRAVAVTEKQR